MDKMDVVSKAFSLKFAIMAKYCMLALTVFKITFQLNLILLINYTPKQDTHPSLP